MFIIKVIMNNLWFITTFVFWYPAIMSIFWIVGGMIYFFSIERKKQLPLDAFPLVSILVPAYNEADNITEVVKRLDVLNYPNYEIIVINDGSKDNSSEIETKLAKQYKKVRFVDLRENAGKANALYLGFMAAKGEFLLCIDGDAYIDKDCIRNMVCHFVNPHNGERVGAVTGNPKVRNRSSLLSKIQICEYTSIISLIKRTQRIWGKVMTVSGVCVMYRKRALLECGMWDRDMITEDIAVTWKLEKNFWDVRYEPKAICWMLTPESIKGLAKQRQRWAQGGQEVIFRHGNIFKSWDMRRLIPVYLEQIFSICWVILWSILTIVELILLTVDYNTYISYVWKSQFLSVICIIQIIVSIFLESKYDVKLKRNIIVAAWYPICYWIISGVVAITAIPKTVKSVIAKNKFATWTSPDRGIKDDTKIDEGDEDDIDVIDGKPEDYVEYDNIIVNKQVWWKKIFEWIFIIIGWLYIISYPGYLIYGIIAKIFNFTIYPFFIYSVNVIDESFELFLIVCIVLAISIVLLIVWKEYNLLRFGRKNRRRFRSNVTTEDMTIYFNMNESFFDELQNNNISVLPENPLKNLETNIKVWRNKK